jgi:hypothetical protein
MVAKSIHRLHLHERGPAIGDSPHPPHPLHLTPQPQTAPVTLSSTTVTWPTSTRTHSITFYVIVGNAVSFLRHTVVTCPPLSVLPVASLSSRFRFTVTTTAIVATNIYRLNLHQRGPAIAASTANTCPQTLNPNLP